MTEIKVIEVSLQDDLKDFSRFLWDEGISHRIVELSGKQVLLVGNRQDAEQVSLAYRDVLAGKSRPGKITKKTANPSLNITKLFLQAPLTYLLILLSIAGFLLVGFDRHLGWMQYLTFYEYERIVGVNVWTVPSDDYWRLLTPIFLHFGFLHIIFNMLWLWELGRRVEKVQGSVSLLGIVMTIGLGSNIAQFLYAKAGIFGGMSGVIYGLLGYSWIWSKMCNRSDLYVPRPVMIFMMVSLVACMFGVARLLGVGDVANAAHVGGLLMGLLLGFLAALIELMFTKTNR